MLAPGSNDDGSVRLSLMLGLLFGLVGMGSSAAAIALPVMAADLDITVGVSAWAISLYALTLAVMTAVYGRLSDLMGIRRPLMIGIAVMTLGAVVGAFAPTFEVLLGARLVQGAGAAAVPTLGAAVLSRRYAGPVRSRALGRLAGVAAAVSCLGPLAGGTVEALFGWRAVIALPVASVVLVPFLWRGLPTKGTGARLDLLGAALVAGTAGGLVLLVQSPSTGATVAVAGAILLLLGTPAVVMQVRRRPDGFLPLAVVRNAAVVRSAAAASAIPAAWFALLIAVPAVLVEEGWPLWQVGLLLVPSAVSGLLTPRFAGPTLDRIGPTRSLALAGFASSGALLVAAGGAWIGSAVLLTAAVIVVTVAFGLGQPALMAAVGGATTDDVRGVALGVATLMFMVGGGVGSAVVGGFGDVWGMPGALLLLAVFPLVGILALAREPRRTPDVV